MSKTPDLLHATLRRQLRSLQLSEIEVPMTKDQWRELLFSIDRTYREADELAYLTTAAESNDTEAFALSKRTLAAAQRLDGFAKWACELDTGLVTLSEELVRMFGLNGSELTIGIEQMLEFVFPADRPIAVQLFRAVTASATSRAGELRFMSTGGVERRCLCRFASFANDSGKVVRIDGTVLDISERRAAEDRTRLAGRADALTGVSNRDQFMQELATTLEESRAMNLRAVIALVDLDGFKAVVESCGHVTGDALHDTISRRLRACLRSADKVARLGEDEFVLLMRHTGSDESLKQMMDRILQACSTSVVNGGRSISVAANIGVALFPGDGDDPARLIQSADAARHAAKEAGARTVRYFGEEVRARRLADRALTASLRTAISREEISVAYQPIVDGETLRIVGAEALARWSHPTLGPVSPAEFVQLAEQNGMIGELSEHVIREACRRLAQLPVSLASRYIAVNLSLVQLRSREFVDQLQATLEKCGVGPSRLRVEMSAYAIVEDRELAMYSLTRLHEMGVAIWIDDFGSVSTSIEDLRELPIDGIKIDRPLVSEIHSDSVTPAIQAVVTIARTLGCELIAEGVETRKQRAALLSAGCRMMQGYLFGAPDTFERWHPREPAVQPSDAELAGS